MIKITDDSKHSNLYRYLDGLGYFDHNATSAIDVSYDYTSTRVIGILIEFML
jgi:hypothetical protein